MYMGKFAKFLHFARKSEGFEEFMVSGSGGYRGSGFWWRQGRGGIAWIRG